MKAKPKQSEPLRITKDLPSYDGFGEIEAIAECLNIRYADLTEAICFAHYDAKNTDIFGKTYYFPKIAIKAISLSIFVINNKITIDNIPAICPFHILNKGDVNQPCHYPQSIINDA